MHLISDPELNCRTSDQLDAGSCCGFQTTLFLSGKKFWAPSHLGQRTFKTPAEFWHCRGFLAPTNLHGKLWYPKLTLSSALSSFITYLISHLTLNPQVCATPDHATMPRGCKKLEKQNTFQPSPCLTNLTCRARPWLCVIVFCAQDTRVQENLPTETREQAWKVR